MESIEIQGNDMIGSADGTKCIFWILSINENVVFNLRSAHKSYASGISVIQYDARFAVEVLSDEAIHCQRTSHRVTIWLEMGHYDSSFCFLKL